MRQLMRQQPLPLRMLRAELARIEIHILPVSKSLSAEFLVHLHRFGIGMDVDPAEIRAERLLHFRASLAGQRPALTSGVLYAVAKLRPRRAASSFSFHLNIFLHRPL